MTLVSHDGYMQFYDFVLKFTQFIVEKVEIETEVTEEEIDFIFDFEKELQKIKNQQSREWKLRRGNQSLSL